MRLVGLVAALAIVPAVSVAQETPPPSPSVCGAPAALNDGWPIDKPESVGLDGARLCGIAARLKPSDGVHSVVIVRHGKLVFEQYYPGDDYPWGLPDGRYNFDATMKHDMRSVSKSVVSLLVGVAIDRKLIAGVDEPVVKFFPDYASLKTPDWEKITLRHLLTMSSGMRWDEGLAWTDPRNDEPHLGKDADPLRYVLAKPFDAPPDTVWTYNGGSTDLLGSILERVSGKPLNEFAREALFQPLGITDWQWQTYDNGKFSPAAGLRLRPRDAARLGQLVLNKGAWDGQQVVSPAWISESITPRFQAIGFFGSIFFYGYQWWMGRSLADGKEVKWVAAQGLGGQRIFIIPDLDLVVMTTAGVYLSPRQGNAALDILASVILPAVLDNNDGH